MILLCKFCKICGQELKEEKITIQYVPCDIYCMKCYHEMINKDFEKIGKEIKNDKTP